MEKDKQNIDKETEGKKKKKIFSLKKYLRDFLLFVDKELVKTFKILLIIALLLIAISMKFAITSAAANECEGTCLDNITLWSNYSSNIQVIGVAIIAGIVPYIYAPILGFVGILFNEVSRVAYLIKGYGYFGGIGLGIVPLILNIVIICIAVSLGMYICRTVTVGYKISNLNNMNFTNFRIRLYDVLKKQDKVEYLTKKKEKKINKLEKGKEKLNYLQILNMFILVCIVQFISSLIQSILL